MQPPSIYWHAVSLARPAEQRECPRCCGLQLCVYGRAPDQEAI